MPDGLDEGIVVRAQGGDQLAFAKLADHAYDRLHTVAVGILRDRDLAEDALQQALVTVWRELPKLRDPARFEAWTYRVIVNACHREARHGRRWLPGSSTQAAPALVAREALQAIADRDQLERGFRRLSVDHRAVVVLHYFRDLPAPEIAEVLGVPVGTVHSRLHHAMRQLRAALQADARGNPEDHPTTEVAR